MVSASEKPAIDVDVREKSENDVHIEYLPVVADFALLLVLERSLRPLNPLSRKLLCYRSMSGSRIVLFKFALGQRTVQTREFFRAQLMM